ncbi:hypothetical protein BH10PSE7_BH10PSE7_36990 [soil metagenome]
MIKFAVLSIAALAAFAVPASASQPPVTFIASPDKVAEFCSDWGTKASLTSWSFEDEQYGCANTETGAVIVCEKDQTCTLYFGPRPDVMEV